MKGMFAVLFFSGRGVSTEECRGNKNHLSDFPTKSHRV